MLRTRLLALGAFFLVSLAGAANAAPAGDRRFTVGEGSQVSYHVKAKLIGFLDESIDGTSQKVRGEVLVSSGRPTGWAEADVTTFKSGIKGRDTHVAQILGHPTHPTVRFDLAQLLEFDPASTTGQAIAVGTLTANGTSRPLQVPIRYRLEGRALRIEGEAPLRFRDFAIAPPIMGFGLKRAPEDLLIRLRLEATEQSAS